MNEHEHYSTTELDIAAYLHAIGYTLLDARPKGQIVEFSFDPGAANAVHDYFTGATVEAREVFKAHRHLRTIIRQVKGSWQSSTSNRNEENNHESYRNSRQQ